MNQYYIPPGYVQYGSPNSASTSPSSSPSPPFAYWVPPPYKSTPVKEYRRHAKNSSYGSPTGHDARYAPTEYPSPGSYKRQPNRTSPPTTYQEHVSRDDFEHVHPKARRYSSTADPRGGGGRRTGSNSYSKESYHFDSRDTPPRRHASVKTQTQRIYIDTSDSADDSPTYTHIKPIKLEPRHKHPTKAKANNHFFYTQAAQDSDDSPAPRRSTSRRQSTSRPSTATRPAKVVDPPREATAADALKCRIPAGYSLKNWDPDEAPVMLLGSVFDANSLGKWIYDWTVYHHGPATPMSEVAGDLWLLLIKLAHKMKRAEECSPRIKLDDDYETVQEFLEGGDRLWANFKKLLKMCEEYMWKVAKKAGGKGGPVMGKNSGCEFVDSMFGRDRKLEETQSLMQRIRLWNMRFDANCEEICRYSKA